MTQSDHFSAIFFLLLSLFVCQQSVKNGLGTLGQPGPGLLAFGAGAGIGLLALWLLFSSILSKDRRRQEMRTETSVLKGKLFWVCLSLFGYTIAVNWFGFVLSTFSFSLFMLRLIQSSRWLPIIITAVLITTGNYLLFEMWLGLNLPKGFFW